MSGTERKDNDSTGIIKLELCRRDFYKLNSDPKLEHVMLIWPGTTDKFNPFGRISHGATWQKWHSEIDDNFFGWERGARFYESKACTHWIQPLKCERTADIIRNFYPCAELAVETIASLKILNDFFPQQIKTTSAVEKWLLALHQNMTPDANDLFDERALINSQWYDPKLLQDKKRWEGVEISRFRDIRTASMSLLESLAKKSQSRNDPTEERQDTTPGSATHGEPTIPFAAARLLMDDDALEIAKIARDTTKTGNVRAEEILRIDISHIWKTSPQWHDLMPDVSDSAIRQMPFWKRRKEIQAAGKMPL